MSSGPANARKNAKHTSDVQAEYYRGTPAGRRADRTAFYERCKPTVRDIEKVFTAVFERPVPHSGTLGTLRALLDFNVDEDDDPHARAMAVSAAFRLRRTASADKARARVAALRAAAKASEDRALTALEDACATGRTFTLSAGDAAIEIVALDLQTLDAAQEITRDTGPSGRVIGRCIIDGRVVGRVGKFPRSNTDKQTMSRAFWAIHKDDGRWMIDLALGTAAFAPAACAKRAFRIGDNLTLRIGTDVYGADEEGGEGEDEKGEVDAEGEGEGEEAEAEKGEGEEGEEEEEEDQ